MVTINLAKNQHAQDKLRLEIMSAADGMTDSKVDNELNYDRLMQLPYLDAFIKESIRVNPVVTRLRRVCLSNNPIHETDSALANKIKLMAGDRVDISVAGVHSSDQFYECPFQFNPQRFMPENRRHLRADTFLGFGCGPQICFGNRFASMVMKTFLSQILTKYRFKCVDNRYGYQLKVWECIDAPINCFKWQIKIEFL